MTERKPPPEEGALDPTSSIEKALDVLFHVSAAGSAGVSEVARALALPKSTAHRLLTALGRRGLVERDVGQPFLVEYFDVLDDLLVLDADGVWHLDPADVVAEAGYTIPVRRPRGRDILAACGQLKSDTERVRRSSSTPLA